MFPRLFDSRWIGLDGALHFTISSYFAAILIGFIAAAYLGWRDVDRWGIARQRYVDFALWMLIMGVLGSRVMHVLADGFLMDYVHLCVEPMALPGRALESLEPCVANAQCVAEQARGADIGAVCDPPTGLCYPQRDCLRAAKFWAGGLTVYGSLIACVLFGWYYMRKHAMGIARMMDVGGYGIPLGIAIGRLGCLGAGCCYGGVCAPDDPLGVHFPVGSLAYKHHFEQYHDALTAQWHTGLHASLPVFPTQWIDSAYNLIIFAICYLIVRPRKRFHGQVMLTFAILYGACRFVIELWRDDMRGGALGLSTSQLVSVPVLLAGVIAMIVLWRRADRASKPA